jgi:Zn-dependent M28 family amino/carboxypeptidase
MPRRFLLILLLSLTASASSSLDDAGKQWWKNVEYLASDDMQGRNVGTPGFDMAANYVAEQFERTGLGAAGNDGYFQKVWFTETSLITASLKLEHGRNISNVPLPGEADLNFNVYSAPLVEAPVVFAGYGLKVPEADYDDLKGLPVKGAIVAYLTGAPEVLSGNLRAHYNTAEERWKAYKAAGAVGMLAIPNPKTMKTSWAKQTASWPERQMTLTDPRLNPFPGLQFSARWNPLGADELMAGTRHTFSEIVDEAERHKELPHFALKCKLKARMNVSARLVKSKNVVAVHPGSDPNSKDDYVVVSAHLDHLGVGKPVHGDAIYNGAMDDASGVSSVIELAKMLKHMSTKRSIVFLAVTAEEQGELGSEYFAQYPTVKGRIVADVNMDMFLPLFPLKWIEVQGLDESTLGQDITTVAEQAGVKVQADKEPGLYRFTRSDQYSFVKAGVPALAFKFGYQKGGQEEKLFQQWYANRYHNVSDDADQPVDLTAAAKFNEILKALLLRVADAERAPEWREDSIFRRVAAPGM